MNNWITEFKKGQIKSGELVLKEMEDLQRLRRDCYCKKGTKKTLMVQLGTAKEFRSKNFVTFGI